MRKLALIFLFLFFATHCLAEQIGTSVPVREEMVFIPLTHNLNDSTGQLTVSSFSRSSGSTRINPDTGLLEELHGEYDQVFVSPASPADQTIAVSIGTYIIHWSGAGSVSGADDTSTSSQSVLSSTAFLLSVTSAGDFDIDVSAPLDFVNIVELPSNYYFGPDLSVTGITKNNPGVVSVTSHGLTTGQYVYFHDLTEMTELNDTIQRVTYINSDSFSIINTSGYVSAETTGGSCANEVPSALVSNYDSGWKISPPPLTSTDEVQAEPAFEENGLRFMGESVVNLLIYSEDFDEWGIQGNATLTSGFLGPDGEYSAYKYSLLDTTSRAAYSLDGLKGYTGKTYTGSIFIKTDTLRELWLGLCALSGSVNIASTTINIPGDGQWHRYSYTSTLASDYTDLGIKWYELSGTGDRFYVFGANLTETSYLAPYIPSHGAQTVLAGESLSWTMTDALKNILSDAIGDATSEGTAIVQITPGYDINAANTNTGVVMIRSTTPSLLSTDLDGFITNDGTTTVNKPESISSMDPIIVAIIWSKSGNTLRLGNKRTGSSWVWDTQSASYDGSFTLDATLNIGVSNPYPFHIKNLGFFRRALSTDIIEANY